MKRNAGLVAVLVTLIVLLPAGLPPLATAQEGRLAVDAARSLGAISPYVYGSNHGPWAAVPLDLLPAARQSGLTFLRFPGGNWGDLNDIAPWQLDFFMTLCNLMDAEPSVHVRLEGGTPDKAAELVRYANLEKDYAIRYWAIGNEPDLFDDYDTERFNREWRAMAEAMLAADPSIILLGPELSQYPPYPLATPRDARGRDWLTEFLRANGDLVNIVTIHRYPFPTRRDRATTVDELLTSSTEWDTIIPNLRAVIREVTGRDLPVGVTEVNSHWSATSGNEASPDSFPNALWLADVLGRMITQQVEIVAHFTLQAPHSFGGWGLFGQVDVIRPSYYVYQLYQRFGSTQVAADSTAPEVTVYAALREDGTLTIMAINLGADEQTLPLEIAHFAPGGAPQVWRLDADHLAEPHEDAPPGETITLPGHSATLVVLPGAPQAP